MDRIYAEGDRYVGYFVLFHFAVGLALAPFYDTWFDGVWSIGTLSTGDVLRPAGSWRRAR